MNRTTRLLVLLLLFFPLFLRTGFAAPWGDLPFSAQVIRTHPEHRNQSSQGKMFVGTQGIRTETVHRKQPVWMIYNPSQKTVWTVFPEQKTYMEQIGIPMDRPPLPDEPNSPCQSKLFLCKPGQQQVIHGRHTIRWTLLRRDKKGVQPYAQLWIDSRLKIAIREQYADGLTIEMVKIQEQPQPDQLFRLPDGYRKIELLKEKPGSQTVTPQKSGAGKDSKATDK